MRLVYNKNELVSSQNAQYLEYLNRYLNLKNCFIKIENINETSVEFNYIYKDIDFLDSEDSEVIVEPNELNYINKYLLLNDIISMYKFELVISDYEGEFNLENILSIKDLNNNYVNAINIEENNENHKIVYFILQPNVTYLVNINLYSLLNDVAFNDVDIILRYCNTPDYQKTIADDYSINEILASNLNGFSLLTYKTYGRYSLIFDVLDKNQILQDFNIKILVSSVTGNVITYYNSISQDSQSCINYIDIYKGDSVFILYPISSFNSNFLIETNLFYEISKTVTLITDKEGNNSSLLGTEVILNQGLYESNVITTGFSRCMFLEPNAYSVIRQNYFWFSTNDEVAEVSNFGTVLAKKAGVTIIYCIYKYDFTVIGMYRILVVEDNDSNSVYLNYGLDVRNNGDSSGTEVDLNGGIKYSIGNHTEIITIGEGYTRYICLGNDSPSQILQHFVWESNSECVYVSQFGTILGMKKSDEYCTITGTYKFNSKFKVIINISVE